MESCTIARKLYERSGVEGSQELAINTAIESGDWGYLQEILSKEASRTNAIPAKDLIRLARLALEAGSLYVDHFRDAALSKAPDDPEVNIAAYMLSTERGEEYRSQQAHEWFSKAIKQSGPKGPVRSVSLRELVNQAPHWNERVDNVDQTLRRAEVPLFMAAGSVRRRLIDLTLGQALHNIDPDDTRIRYPIFAFSGARPTVALSGTKSAAFDVTSLITLDYLGLLEKAFAYFERSIIAPKTLSMLFLGRWTQLFGQPERVNKL